MKKRIALLLALALALGLAACGGSPEATSSQAAPEGLEHMDITLAWWDGESILAGDEILDFVEDRFNVTFEVMNTKPSR